MFLFVCKGGSHVAFVTLLRGSYVIDVFVSCNINITGSHEAQMKIVVLKKTCF